MVGDGSAETFLIGIKDFRSEHNSCIYLLVKAREEAEQINAYSVEPVGQIRVSLGMTNGLEARNELRKVGTPQRIL